MNIGHYNQLPIIKRSEHGLILDGGNGTTVLLPNDEIPENLGVDPWASATAKSNTETDSKDQSIEVFVYTNADGEPVATTTKPRVTVGDAAVLTVVSQSPAGLWLDWGLDQDLLLPRSEQAKAEQELADQQLIRPETDSRRGAPRSVFVYVFLDPRNNRICATTRLHRYLNEVGEDFAPWQKVNLIIAGKTALGFKAIIDLEHIGLLYADEVFQPLYIGERMEGYIKAIRDDGKIDLTLYPKASVLKDELSERILADLQQHDGELPLTDKSPPEEIYARYQVSKKNYKKAIGNLYKSRLIVIEDHCIKLVGQ